LALQGVAIARISMLHKPAAAKMISLQIPSFLPLTERQRLAQAQCLTTP